MVEPARAQSLDALYVIALDGRGDRDWAASGASIDEAYEMAILMMREKPGKHNEITLLEKAQGSKLIYARVGALPLGEGGFGTLRSKEPFLFQLKKAKLTHDGVTHEKIVVWQPKSFGFMPRGAEDGFESVAVASCIAPHVAAARLASGAAAAASAAPAD